MSSSREEQCPSVSVVGIASNRRDLGVPTRSSIERDMGIKISGRRINGCSLERGTWRQLLNYLLGRRDGTTHRDIPFPPRVLLLLFLLPRLLLSASQFPIVISIAVTARFASPNTPTLQFLIDIPENLGSRFSRDFVRSFLVLI